MKMPSIVIFGLFLAGCASPQPRVALTVEQATKLAMQLANAKSEALWHIQPFRDGQPARFESEHWTWYKLAGDIEAKVEIAADGSTNKVSVAALPVY